MKIRTYMARDMRSALRQIREEQGPDAVILSSRQVAGGVEVSAAVDPEPVVAVAPAAVPPVQHVRVAPVPPVAGIAPEVGEELRHLRQILEQQMARLAWNDLTRRAPAQAALLQTLTEIGLPQSLAGALVAAQPGGLGHEDALRRALGELATRLQVTGDAWLEHGGRIAFIGPTGVGKTTAIARLAARWVMRHGPRDIAIVSLDTQRFGAEEQLRVLGRLLGVETFVPEEVERLPELLARLSRRRFVLIDTAGLGPRDDALLHAQDLVQATQDLQVCLVLSAAAQAGALQQAFQRFAVFEPTALLLTKLDEATSLGAVLALVAGSGLPLTYLCDGQHIPEDMVPARAAALVDRAVALAREHGATASEELLTRNFGGVAHVFA
ncbi:MAG: hypothetical protein RL026_747 [Pseudomonadota bacterium]|jgi:flagellar biosynthesis protein FlhF